MSWSNDVYHVLLRRDVRLIATVPDGGLVRLLDLCNDEPTMRVVTLTSEQEGVALLCGAWLGGQRGALLMQSSGVGNCVNMLSLPATTRTPCLMLVTMRGEHGEFNPWQIPMGQAAESVLRAMGVLVQRANAADEVGELFAAAADLAFATGSSAAVLVGQRVIGAKRFGGE